MLHSLCLLFCVTASVLGTKHSNKAKPFDLCKDNSDVCPSRQEECVEHSLIARLCPKTCREYAGNRWCDYYKRTRSKRLKTCVEGEQNPLDTCDSCVCRKGRWMCARRG
ncbi:unnamed protein product, partial [Meganyctiphanes norvegica]